MAGVAPYRVRIGGLMRCCTATIAERMRPATPTKRGEQLRCRYCHNVMRVANDGTWEWDEKASREAPS